MNVPATASAKLILMHPNAPFDPLDNLPDARSTSLAVVWLMCRRGVQIAGWMQE